MEVELDATDQLERASGLAINVRHLSTAFGSGNAGLPKSALVIANTLRAATGSIQLIGPPRPSPCSSGVTSRAARAVQSQHHRGGV